MTEMIILFPTPQSSTALFYKTFIAHSLALATKPRWFDIKEIVGRKGQNKA